MLNWSQGTDEFLRIGEAVLVVVDVLVATVVLVVVDADVVLLAVVVEEDAADVEEFTGVGPETGGARGSILACI